MTEFQKRKLEKGQKLLRDTFSIQSHKEFECDDVKDIMTGPSKSRKRTSVMRLACSEVPGENV